LRDGREARRGGCDARIGSNRLPASLRRPPRLPTLGRPPARLAPGGPHQLAPQFGGLKAEG